MVDASIVERYVGLVYDRDHFDCADLAMKVQREVFGREVVLPQDRRRPVSPRGMNQAICESQHAVARRRPEGVQWQDGDGVLLKRGWTFPTHVGVLFSLGDPAEWYVLHNTSKKCNSVLTRVRDLHLDGWRIEGVYEWI